jgi:hypothetical protein
MQKQNYRVCNLSAFLLSYLSQEVGPFEISRRVNFTLFQDGNHCKRGNTRSCNKYQQPYLDIVLYWPRYAVMNRNARKKSL